MDKILLKVTDLLHRQFEANDCLHVLNIHVTLSADRYHSTVGTVSQCMSLNTINISKYTKMVLKVSVCYKCVTN